MLREFPFFSNPHFPASSVLPFLFVLLERNAVFPNFLVRPPLTSTAVSFPLSFLLASFSHNHFSPSSTPTAFSSSFPHLVIPSRRFRETWFFPPSHRFAVDFGFRHISLSLHGEIGTPFAKSFKPRSFFSRVRTAHSFVTFVVPPLNLFSLRALRPWAPVNRVAVLE